MKLGKAVRNIRCGHNYKDKQLELRMLGFDFKTPKDAVPAEAIDLAILAESAILGESGALVAALPAL